MFKDPLSLLSETDLSNLSITLKEAFCESIEYMSEVASGHQAPDADRIKACQDIFDRIGFTKKKSIEIDQTIHTDLPKEIVMDGLKTLYQSLGRELPSNGRELVTKELVNKELGKKKISKEKLPGIKDAPYIKKSYNVKKLPDNEKVLDNEKEPSNRKEPGPLTSNDVQYEDDYIQEGVLNKIKEENNEKRKKSK